MPLEPALADALAAVLLQPRHAGALRFIKGAAGRRLGEYVKDATQPNGRRPVQEFVYLDA